MVLLVGLTCLLYRGDLDLGLFQLDDPTYITNNPLIHEVSSTNLKAILTQPYFANFSPTHLLSYMTDIRLGGNSPHVLHLSSNLWAGLVAAMVYLLGLVLFSQGNQSREMATALAAGAGLLFAVHPVHVEAVAWISSRKDLVAASFTIPSLTCYLQYRRGWGGR